MGRAKGVWAELRECGQSYGSVGRVKGVWAELRECGQS